MRLFRKKFVVVPQCPKCGKMLGEWNEDDGFRLSCFRCKHVAMVGLSHEMLRDWFKSMSKKRRNTADA